MKLTKYCVLGVNVKTSNNRIGQYNNNNNRCKLSTRVLTMKLKVKLAVILKVVK